MKKRLKNIISFLLVLSLSACISTPLLADELSTDGNVKITNELAIEMADNFVQDIYPDGSLSADCPVKIFDTDGKAIGYTVNYYKNDTPYGYVIFDDTDPSLISEYSFGEGAQNPYVSIVGDVCPSDNTFLVKTGPFSYSVIDTSENTITDNYYNVSQLSPARRSAFSDSKKTSDWKDVFLESGTVRGNYNILETNHLDEFIAVSETTIESKTGHYACSVSALYACAEYYKAVDYKNLKSDYMDIWNETGTTVVKTDNGHIYGSTDIYKSGPGFIRYCKKRGVSVSQRTVENPSYSFFKSSIDGKNMAVIHCGILDKNTHERDGHAMAVEGYATIKHKNTGSQIQSLMVFDGWHEYVRYLNLNFSRWTDVRGTAFYG